MFQPPPPPPRDVPTYIVERAGGRRRSSPPGGWFNRTRLEHYLVTWRSFTPEQVEDLWERRRAVAVNDEHGIRCDVRGTEELLFFFFN